MSDLKRPYEMMYIVKPTLDDEAVEGVAAKIDELLTNLGAKLEKTEKRGRKKLAYEVKDFKDGFYMLSNFHFDPSQIKELERLLKLNEDVIRHLLIRLDEHAIAAAAEKQSAQAAAAASA